MPMSQTQIHVNVAEISDEMRNDRSARLGRTMLDPAEFQQLAEAGMWTLTVPTENGGTWVDGKSSTRGVVETVRTLAAGDAAVALVAAMHPGVISFWLNSRSDSRGWTEQRDAVFESAMAGRQWGTMSSEPGTGGDITQTRTAALPSGAEGALPGKAVGLTGQKHFASGTGITDFMMTVAREADGAPTIYMMDVSENPLDGSSGLTITSEWDGIGMAATQSHGVSLEAMSAVQIAWPGSLEELAAAANPMIASLFCAVALGILDEAVATARIQLEPRAQSMRALERHEWLTAVREHWLADAAYQHALRAIEGGGDPLRASLQAKYSIAELAESVTRRLCRVLGGSAFSARSPFAHWHEDVRALGFLRPPWALAHDQLFDTSWLSDQADGPSRGRHAGS
jgi:alkylation response protein AidB-like acyl-CoA dehydrogenase